jgi:hypothetical protein
MTGAMDQKTYWGLGEIVMWIRTRDYERVAAMSDLSEEDAMALAMFTDRARLSEKEAMALAVFPDKARFDLRPLPDLTATNSDAGREAAAPQGHERSSDIGGPIPMPPDQALDDLHRKVHSRRVPMTAIKCDGNSDEQIPVPPVELNDLIFLLVPGHPVAPVGLWSRSRRDTLVWRSPQFLRTIGVRVWPARNRKTAAVYGATLRHLREIMTPEAPLTKREAQRRCLTEVPNAYLEAFKKAWAELEPSCKRGRGKHGPRGH